MSAELMRGRIWYHQGRLSSVLSFTAFLAVLGEGCALTPTEVGILLAKPWFARWTPWGAIAPFSIRTNVSSDCAACCGIQSVRRVSDYCYMS